MAIDVLTRGTATPIVVGDGVEMKRYSRCSIESVDGKTKMTLSDNLEHNATPLDSLCTDISDVAASSFLQNKFVLLVNLSPTDDIASAILTPINDLVSPIRELNEAEIKTLATDLVSEDFQLDFLR